MMLSKRDRTDYTGTILRFATAFGVSARTRLDLLINEFVYKSVHNEIISIYDQHTWRPYCHVNDFGILIDKVLSAETNDVYFEVFNGGSGQNNYTKKDILEAIRSFGYDPTVIYNEHDADPRDYKVSFEKANQKIGFVAQYCLNNGINELIDFSQNIKFDKRFINNILYA